MKRIVLSETFQTIALLILLAGWLIKFACVGFEVSQLSCINNYGSLIGILILINLLWLRKTNCNQYLSSAPPLHLLLLSQPLQLVSTLPICLDSQAHQCAFWDHRLHFRCRKPLALRWCPASNFTFNIFTCLHLVIIFHASIFLRYYVVYSLR